MVHAAAIGYEAFTILRTHPIAGIILDAILRDEHSLGLVDRLRVISSTRILLLTGYSCEALRSACP